MTVKWTPRVGRFKRYEVIVNRRTCNRRHKKFRSRIAKKIERQLGALTKGAF